MDQHLESKLREIADQESQAAIRCLVAAELAVEDGRFNIAKVMRAAAHTARVRAMQLQRLLAAQASPVAAVQAEKRRRDDEHKALGAVLAITRRGEDEAVVRPLQRLHEAAYPLADILNRSVESLVSHRDIMESDVAQSLWGCQDCGYMAETERPDACPHCGALGAEFEWFGPFYSVTRERLGRRRVEEITAILQRSPEALEHAFADVADAVLSRRPSPSEWCMKETAGHMLDVTELFLRRVRRMLEADTAPTLDEPVPAWRILEGRGYPDTAGREIANRFRFATEEALSLTHTLANSDWVRQGWNRGRPCNILDLGSWLANHNVAHLKQVEALRGQFSA